MGKKYTHDEAVKMKKKAFKSLTNTLESFLAKPLPNNSHDIDYIKKVTLISKWLTQYSNYLSFEDKFNPKQNISYTRGDIVFVNFGFNLGSELGGEHYAVVLDKESNHSSSTLTVIPLSSLKPNKDVHPNDLYLGNEVYEKLNLKLKTRRQSLLEQSLQLKLMIKIARDKLNSLNPLAEANDEIEALVDGLENDLAKLKEEISDAQRIRDEILSLKIGSVAKIKQITTISKIRIYNPKKSSDPLYGIRFSEDTMAKINEKVKELYIF